MQLVADDGRDDAPLCLIGPSAAAAAMRSALAALARSDCPILLRGAPGTRKREFAEELHRRGARAVEPFTVLDFTAADEARTQRAALGLASIAAGRVSGTVYVPCFDAVSDAPQTALVGALKAARRRARVIVGTTADVEHLLTIGQLRPDLASLLAVRLTLPELRERLDDVAAIAELCITRWAHATGTTAPLIRDSAVAQLRAYAWPGNIRELQQVLVTACTLARGRSLTAEMVGAALGRRPRRRAGSDVAPLREVARNYILVAIARCGHNHSLAARRLGIGRSTLFRKLHAGVGGTALTARTA